MNFIRMKIQMRVERKAQRIDFSSNLTFFVAKIVSHYLPHTVLLIFFFKNRICYIISFTWHFSLLITTRLFQNVLFFVRFHRSAPFCWSELSVYCIVWRFVGCCHDSSRLQTQGKVFILLFLKTWTTMDFKRVFYKYDINSYCSAYWQNEKRSKRREN